MSCGTPYKGFRGLVRAKLGRCTRCMRLALTGVVLAWLVFFALPRIWTSSTASLVVLVIAGALSALWLLHLLRFIQLAVHRAQVLGLRSPPGTARPNPLVTILVALWTGVLSSIPRLAFAPLAAGMPPCNCYFHDDCGFLRWCNYNDPCYWVKKGETPCPSREEPGGCDGTCQWFGHIMADADAQEVARTVDLYFSAFHHAATQLDGPGRPGAPDDQLLRDARSTSLPPGWHDELQSFVFAALDLVLGRDFELGEWGWCSGRFRYKNAFLAHIPDSQGMPALIDATRNGFTNAILRNSIDEIEPPIKEFWATFPSYTPAHGGRCYPHGHDIYDTAIECQIANLRAMLAAMLLTGADTGT